MSNAVRAYSRIASPFPRHLILMLLLFSLSLSLSLLICRSRCQSPDDPVPAKFLPNSDVQLFAPGAALLGDDCRWQMRLDLYERPAAKVTQLRFQPARVFRRYERAPASGLAPVG